MDLPRLDTAPTAAVLENFVATGMNRSGLDGYVLGLSGGIDSALAASIAVRAVGSDRVRGFIMPYQTSAAESAADAHRLAEKLGITTETVPIAPMIDAYYENVGATDPVRAGNKMARERMAILFDRAFAMNRLVLGTSNRTEICLGYGTWYGDVACSLNPLGQLYKTQVRQLARYYDVPESIVTKAPSADLWPGQTDESELGLEYDKVDKLLYMIIDQAIMSRQELNRSGFEDGFIDRAVSLLNRFYFKRHLPAVADLGLKPIPDKVEIV